jgi:hypothetical protein
MASNRRTLQNPLLYKKLLGNILDSDFDEHLIDTTLEYEEAKRELARRHGVKFKQRKESPMQEVYSGLEEALGFSNTSIFNALISDPNPFSEQEMGELSYSILGRSPRAMRQDIARKARRAKNLRQYMKAPNRYDWPTVDTPGSRLLF